MSQNWWEAMPLADEQAPSSNWWEAMPLADEEAEKKKPGLIDRASNFLSDAYGSVQASPMEEQLGQPVPEGERRTFAEPRAQTLDFMRNLATGGAQQFGDTMQGFEVPDEPLIERLGAPVTPEKYDELRGQYEMATPDARQKMIATPGVQGNVWRALDQDYNAANYDLDTAAPLDDRREAQVRRLQDESGAAPEVAANMAMVGMRAEDAAQITESPADRELSDFLADTGNQLARAALQAPKMVIDVAQLPGGAIPIIGEALVVASEELGGVIEYLAAKTAPQLRKKVTLMGELAEAGDIRELVKLLAKNPDLLAEVAIPSIGSMFLIGGVGAAGGKAAQSALISQRAAQQPLVRQSSAAFNRLLANKGADAATRSALAANVAVVAGAAFDETDGPLDAKYLAATIAGAGAFVAGRLTGGGAEGMLARSAVSTRAGGMATQVPKAILREGGQEYIEEGSEALGVQTGEVYAGTREAFNLPAVQGQATIGAAAGMALGGVAGVATSGGAPAPRARRAPPPINTERDQNGVTKVITPEQIQAAAPQPSTLDSAATGGLVDPATPNHVPFTPELARPPSGDMALKQRFKNWAAGSNEVRGRTEVEAGPSDMTSVIVEGMRDWREQQENTDGTQALETQQAESGTPTQADAEVLGDTTRDSLLAQYEQAEPMSPQSDALAEQLKAVTQNDVEATLNSGDMPVFETGRNTFVTITPSAQQPGKYQLTRYNNGGVFGDTQYDTIEAAIRDNSLETQPRLTQQEAESRLSASLKAEAEYQAAQTPTPTPTPAQAPTTTPQLTASGKPFASEKSAATSAKSRKLDLVPVAVEGGWGLVPKQAPTVSASRPVILQNRNRATPTSVTQMQNIASAPDYGRLGFSRDFANGAPVVAGGNIPANQVGRSDVAVASDGRRIPVQYAVVEADTVLASNRADGMPNTDYGNQSVDAVRAIAGNGRIAGLQAAYRNGTTAAYQGEMTQDTLHGIDPAVMAGMRNPVLVRVMPNEEVTADIGDVSNTTGNLNLSPVEQANNDAERVSLDDLRFGEDGAVTPDTVRQFVRAMPQAEQGALVDTNGQPTKQAVDRLNAAVFSRAYGNDQLVRLFAQAQDAEARNVLSALAQVAPKMARLDGAGALDVRDLVAQAAEIAVNARRDGISLTRAAQQMDMTTDPNVGVVLQLFADNARSVRPVVEALGRMADFAYTEATKPSEDMFGPVARGTRQDAINQLRTPDERASQEAVERASGRESVQEDSARRADDAQRPEDVGDVEAGRPVDVGSEADPLLSSYSLDELAERQAAIDATEQAETRAEREAADKERATRERDDVRRRSEAAADTFELGQSAEDNLSGQGPLFSRGGRTQAASGGQDGVNGYFYKGGQFLPSTMAEPGKWKVGKKWVTSGRELVGPGEFAHQPTPFSVSLFRVAGMGYMTTLDASGKLTLNPGADGNGVRGYDGTPITPDTEIKPGVKGVLGKESLTLQEIMYAWNSGQRWFDVQPDADTITTQGDTPLFSRGAPGSPATITPVTTLTAAFKEAFPNQAGALDSMIKRGEEGRRGGVVFAEDEAALAQAFADKTGRTLEEAMAVLQMSKSANDGRIRRTVQELVEAAQSQEKWRTWYERHETVLIEVFGADADLFQGMLSATSQATGVKGNVTLALKAYEQMMTGQEFTGFLPAVIKNLERIRDSQALQGAKISQYGEANKGAVGAIAVDRHIAMLFFNTKTPNPRQIAAAKTRIVKIADQLGWEPRQVQAALWAYNQVRLGADPSKVQSYDAIIKERSDAIAALRARLGRGQRDGVSTSGAVTGRDQQPGRSAGRDQDGNVDVLFSKDGTINGFYDPQSGLVFLNQSAVTADTIGGVMLHEAMHGGQNSRVDAQAMKMVADRDKASTPATLRPLMADVAARMEAAGVANDAREASAYIVEMAANYGRQNGFSVLDGKFMTWLDGKQPRLAKFLRDWIAGIRAWGMKHGVNLNLTVDDLVAFAQQNMAAMARGEAVTGSGPVSGSMGGRRPGGNRASQQWVPQGTPPGQGTLFGQGQGAPQQTMNAQLQQGMFGTRNSPILLDQDGLLLENPSVPYWLSDLVRARFVRLFESATDTLRRSNSPVLKDLAGKIDNFYDKVDARMGWFNGKLRPTMKDIKQGDLRHFEAYWRHHDNGRDVEAQAILAANPKVAQLIEQVKEVFHESGVENQRIGVKVFDSKTGGHRLIGKITRGKFWPRAFKEDVSEAFATGGESNPALWQDMLDALIADGHLQNRSEAAAYLRGYVSGEIANDYFAGIEKARGEKLPEMFYDYSWEVVPRYAMKWANRLSQIEQFGQVTGPNTTDLFDKVLERTLDKKSNSYIKALRDRVYNVRTNGFFEESAANLNMIATATQLGNPATATLNLLGGSQLNVMFFGERRVAKAFGELAADWSRLYQDGVELGILGRDTMSILQDADQQAGRDFLDTNDKVKRGLAWMATKGLKYGGYTGTEQIIRATAMQAARGLLMDALNTWNTNPGSRTAAKYDEFMARYRIDRSALLAENGRGEETAKYLRQMVNVPQGSYKIDRVPLLVDTPLGRLFLKYQKFGTQVALMGYENVVKPLGESLMGRSSTGRAEALGRALHWLTWAYLGGLAVTAAREAMFGMLATGPDLEELEKALEDDDTAKKMFYLYEHAWSRLMAGSVLGIFGNYAQMARDVSDRRQARNPLDPPAFAILNSTVGLGLTLQEQGRLTARDVDQYLIQSVALYRSNKRLGATAADALGFDHREVAIEMARRDTAEIRRIARNYAKLSGVEARRTTTGRYGKTENTPENVKVFEALAIGDAETARARVREIMKNTPAAERQARLQSLRSGARARHPIQLGGSTSGEQRMLFRQWAKKNLPESKVQMIEQRARAYERTMSKAGL